MIFLKSQSPILRPQWQLSQRKYNPKPPLWPEGPRCCWKLNSSFSPSHSICSPHCGLLIVIWLRQAFPEYLPPTLLDIHTARLVISTRFLCKSFLFWAASLNFLFKISLPKCNHFLSSYPRFFFFIALSAISSGCLPASKPPSIFMCKTFSTL